MPLPSAAHGGSRSGCRRRCARRRAAGRARAGRACRIRSRSGRRRRGRRAAARRAPRPGAGGTIWRVERTRGRTAPSRRRSHASASARTTRASAAPSASRFAWIAATARAVALDEDGARRAARQRLDAERARAGEQVEHAQRPRRRRGSRRAPRARGRTWAACRRPARSALEPAAAVVARPRDAPSRRDRLELRAEARRRRRAAGRARARRARGSRASSSSARRVRALEQLLVLRDARDAELRQPVLARAEHLARAAQLRGRPRPAEAVALAGERLEPRQRRVAEQDADARRARRGRSARAAGGAARSRSARPPRSSSRWRSARRCPTSITLVATSTSASRAANARHRLRLLLRGHLAVDQRDTLVAELGLRPAARPRSSRPWPAAPRDSATSGQTTNTWRPAAISSRARS